MLGRSVPSMSISLTRSTKDIEEGSDEEVCHRVALEEKRRKDEEKKNSENENDSKS